MCFKKNEDEECLRRTEKQRNGNDKQNVSLRYLFNIAFLKVRGVLKPWESSCGWVMAPLVAASSEGTRAASTAAWSFKLIHFDRERSAARITVLISLQFYLCVFSFFFFQKLPQLSAKSILPLVGDNEHVRQASNEHRRSRAPQLNIVTSCRHFWGRQKREVLAFRDQLKTHIQIDLKGAQ